jgi:DNA-binding transcriptional LysR family regulator
LEQASSRLTASHLRLVVAIAEANSLVGAAKRLNMTQPAATKSLQVAEQQLEVRLFDRTSSGMVPTIFGEALIEQGRLILSQLSHAAQEIHDLREGTGGRIAIGTLLTASATLLPRAITRMREERPRLAVTIMEGTNDVLLPALRSGELDLVVGRLADFHQGQDLSEEVLFRDIACVVARRGHPLVGRKRLRLQDTTEWSWILPPEETTLRHQVEKAFYDAGLEPPVPAVESVSHIMNRSLLVDSDYLSVWPWQAATLEERAGQVAILPLSLPPTIGPVGVTTRREARLSPAAQILVRTLHDVAAEMPLSPLLESALAADLCPPGDRPRSAGSPTSSS